MADTEREAFEAWAKAHCFQLEGAAPRRVGWYYFNKETDVAWDAWMARAALASRPVEVDDRTPRPIATAPHDGTEVLAWSITGKTWHQVYWKTQENGDWMFLDPFPPRWACRWNSDYYQGQSEFSHWLPIPGAPSHTTNKEK